MGAPHKSPWRNSTTVETLERLWREDVPAAQIGKQLGVTKNAVLGRAHRMNLPMRQAVRTGEDKMVRKPPVLKVVKVIKRAPVRVKKVETPPPVVVAFGAKTLLELNRSDCRFVCDDGKFCAQTVERGSWCENHRHVVFWMGDGKRKPMTANELTRSLRRFTA